LVVVVVDVLVPVFDVPRTTPPLVVVCFLGAGLSDGVGVSLAEGDGKADASGDMSKLGATLADGEGDVRLKEGSLIVPTERRMIKPIAPTIIAATRPDVIDFMSYILYSNALSVKVGLFMVG
jgi:hypothetical protein